MKLISLNTWGGAAYAPLMEFVKEHAPTTDIFCFQEIYSFPEARVSHDTHLNLLEDLVRALPDFSYHFSPIQEHMDEYGPIPESATFGHAVFVRSTLPSTLTSFTYTNGGFNTLEGDDFSTLGFGFQTIAVTTPMGELTVFNMHGVSRPGDKLDTPGRIAQSALILQALQSSSGTKILCGDFNLDLETESVRMIEGSMQNLIKTHRIETTRSVINEQKYVGKKIQKYADYMFVSPDITIQSFEVPRIAISDHLPMILECAW